jgi:hypothetical protein
MIRRALVVLAACVMVVASSTSALAWTDPTTIDNFGNSDIPTTSLRISPKGGTFVAWAQGGDDLYWSKRTATGWKDTHVAGGSFVSCYDSSTWNTIGPSAAFTTDGEPKIASACMAVSSGAKILYSKKVNGKWKTNTVGYGPSDGLADASAITLSLALSPANKPSIVMTESDEKDITRFRLVKGKWKGQTLVNGVTVCCGTQYKMADAAFDPVTGLLGVAWTNHVGTATSLAYAEYNANGNRVGAIEDIPLDTTSASGRPSLGYLSNGDIAIAVQQDDAVTLSLALARRISGVWSIGTVDNTAADVGLNPSLVIVDDVFHIAYPDDTNGDLKYATSTDGTAWTIDTAVTTGDVGDVPSLGINGSGGIRISYYDLGSTALKGVSGP